jgi:tetratricopeptide (TPR) repeat protein
MTLTSAFILYLALFRLAIISAGVVSIVLGYRLFVRGVWPEVKNSGETSIDAEVAGSRFTVKNAAPGTCFALFGVIIISVMFGAGSPELTLNLVEEAAAMEIKRDIGIKVRSNESGTIDTLTQQGDRYAEDQQIEAAIASYEEALAVVGNPMNELAWLYLGKGRTDEALPLSRLAVTLRPDNANFIDTLAEILLKQGEKAEAMKWMNRAAQLDPQFRKKASGFGQD